MTRILLGVVLIALLVAGSLWVLRPFLPALVWATMIVVPTWPLMRRAEAALGGRRMAAVAVMTTAMLVLIIVPLAVAVTTIVGQADEGMALANKLLTVPIPPAPSWVQSIPLAGEHIASEWNKLAGLRPDGLAERLQPYVAPAAKWVAAQAGHLGLLLIHLLLTVAIAAILYASGERAATAAVRFARKVAGNQGEEVIVLAGKAIAAVALGIVVTALVQAVLGGIGLLVAGVPAVAVLTSVMFIFCIAQLGPGLVMLPAVAWLYWSGSPVWGTVLLVWSGLLMVLDNVLRPLLMRRAVDLPLLLLLVGVIGGLLAFGVVGLFVGPVVLAVTYTLVNAWIEEDREPEPVTRASP